MAEPEEEINYNEASEFFSELEGAPFVELSDNASRVLRGILRGQVMREALGNVLKMTKTEDFSLLASNLLSDPKAVETALRKQGQVMGLTLAIETLIEQAYMWQPAENTENDSA